MRIRRRPATGTGSTRRLFAAYAAVSLLPVLGLGLLLTGLIRGEATARGLAEGRREAQLVGQTTVAPLLNGHDLRSGLARSERSALNRSVRLAVASHRVLRLRVRDLAGAVVYSDDGSGFHAAVEDEALAAARGRTVVRLTRFNSDSNDTGPKGPRVVEVYEPLRAAQNGHRIGVLEMYLPYDPIAADIASGQHRLLAGLGAGLAVLWLTLLGVSASVSRRLRQHARVNAFLAGHDTLTGLPNRNSFTDRARLAVLDASEERPAVVALLDLDRFKEINDTLGHGNGDLLLAELGRRLAGELRENDTIARLGGDEFGVVLRGVHGPSEAVEILGRLRTTLREPLTLDGLPLAVEASVGFALAPTDATDVERLLQCADVAMYVAKRQHLGVARYQVVHDQYDAGALSLLAEMDAAIRGGQLVLHYQPKARVEDGRVLAVEALVRWQHPERGLLYPGDFLLGVEQTELIEPLTRWVLGRALQELPGLDPSGELAVAVNVSARNLTRSEFAGEALAILAESGVQPRRLVLEVTETALLTDPARAADTLHRLADAGVRISIDDFGAGQTSLSYLAALPVAEVKIDKAFVLTMTTDARHAAIVRSVIELGHALGYTVTAEGVETPDTLEQLAAADCDTAQGFLLGRPVPSNELPALLTSVSRSLGVAGSART